MRMAAAEAPRARPQRCVARALQSLTTAPVRPRRCCPKAVSPSPTLVSGVWASERSGARPLSRLGSIHASATLACAQHAMMNHNLAARVAELLEGITRALIVCAALQC